MAISCKILNIYSLCISESKLCNIKCSINQIVHSQGHVVKYNIADTGVMQFLQCQLKRDVFLCANTSRNYHLSWSHSVPQTLKGFQLNIFKESCLCATSRLQVFMYHVLYKTFAIN